MYKVSCIHHVFSQRKIDQVVSKLGRYSVVVAALQETKWFWNEVYKVGNSVVLTAGRKVPRAEVVRQNSRVLLCAFWSSSKCIEGKWQQMEGMELKEGHYYLGNWEWESWTHVLSCHSPIFAASREKKDAFFAILQDALSAIP